MNADIIAAIVAYLQQAFAQSLQVGVETPDGEINPGVWADYARATLPGVPYCVVHDGPETYIASSDASGDSTHLEESIISDGLCQVAWIAPTKETARSLARACVRLLIHTVVNLQCADGAVIHLMPLRTESVPMTDIGVGSPTQFKRVVTVEYRQQWTSP